MFITIQTQYRENYGAHDWDGEGECPQYWKYKGGETYIIPGLSVAEAMDAQAIIDVVAPLIEYRNEASEEYIIDWELLDDSEAVPCNDWDTPWSLSKQDDGTYVAFREIDNTTEYGYMSSDVAAKIESYLMVEAGGRENYLAKYKMKDGNYTDWQGNRIAVAA